MNRYRDGFAMFGRTQFRLPNGDVECRLLQTYEDGVWRSRGTVSLDTVGSDCISVISNISSFPNVLALSRYNEDICIGGWFDQIAIDEDLQYFACHGESLGWYQPNGIGNGPNGPVYDISWQTSGPLYLSGSFNEVDQATGNPQSARNVVRTDGFTWEPLWTDAAMTGEGVVGTAYSIVASGDGFAYIAHGNALSRWNPTPTTPRFQALGASNGTSTSSHYVTLFGAEVYYSGSFDRVDGVEAVDYARAAAGVPPIDWMPLENQSTPTSNDGILSQGHGFLYTTGDFTELDPEANGLVRWDQFGFEAAPNADVLGPPSTQRGFYSRVQHPLTGELCGRNNTSPTGFQTFTVPCYDGNEWRGLGYGIGSGPGEFVTEITKFDGQIVAAGQFASAGDTFEGSAIARWGDMQWEPLGTGLRFDVFNGTPSVAALAHFQGSLYAAGSFDTAGNVESYNIARWDGTQWHNVGNNTINRVNDMIAWQGQLIIADSFAGLLSWDGTTATPIAGLPAGATPTALGIYRGNLVAYYRMGFSTVLTQYDGQQWTDFPGNFNDGNVSVIVEDRDYLYVGGTFRNSPLNAANHIARFNGTAWEAMGTGLTEEGVVTPTPEVRDIVPILGQVFVVGGFNTASGVPALRFAAWDGTGWFGYEPGLFYGIAGSSEGYSLYLDNSTLYLGGTFTQAGDTKSRNFAALDLDLAPLDNIFAEGSFGG